MFCFKYIFVVGVVLVISSSVAIPMKWGEIRVPRQDVTGSTIAMLDAMQQLQTGQAEFFDLPYRQKLFNCFDQLDPDLMKAQDSFWAGIIQYHDQNGVPGDEWGSMETAYQEYNLTIQDYHNIVIYEPCNYASNVAYYHDVTQICDHDRLGLWTFPKDVIPAMGAVFAHLATGSAFMHGSHTSLGGKTDTLFIAAFSFLAHQTSLANIPYSPVLHDLNSTPRRQPALEIVSDLNRMFMEEPVEEWMAIIQDLDMPSYYMTFGGLVMTQLTVSFDEVQVDEIVDFLLELFPVSEDVTNFLLTQYLPELREATRNINVTSETAQVFKGNFASGLIKLLYAFLWQEEIVTDNSIIFKPWVNSIGAKLIPKVNNLANSLNNFPIYDKDFEEGKNIYPGDFECNKVQPHSKWHLESAIGLMDIVYMADDIYQVTKSDKLEQTRHNRFNNEQWTAELRHNLQEICLFFAANGKKDMVFFIEYLFNIVASN